MPDPNDYEKEDDWMAACVPMRIDEGDEQDQAVAACMNMWRGKKSIEEMEPLSEKSLETEVEELAIKLGNRHNRRDQRALQDIHDAAITLGANCPPEITTIPIETEVMSLWFGGDAVKALGNGKVGGYLVRFGSPDQVDLTGEYFTKDTDFGEHIQAPVYYNHGQDPKIGKRKLSKADLHDDEFGVWAETQLSLRDEYEKYIYAQAEQGKMGWSSGTASHLVETEEIGKAIWLKSWPLGLDASLTPTPAEPRNMVIPLKSYLGVLQQQTNDAEGNAEGAGNAPQIESAQSAATKTLENVKEGEMELTQEQINELIASAASKAAEEAIKALPAVNQGGVQVTTDEADQSWAHPSEYFMAVKNAAIHPRDEDVRLRPLKATGMSEGVPAEGGYLLQPQVAGGIIERMYGEGDILSRVSKDPIGPNSNSMLYNAVDESSRVAGSAYGGLLGYWLGEGGTKTPTKPTFRQVELKLKKVAALCYATDEQLADTVALESWLTRTVPKVLIWMTEEAIINGNGVAKPLGIMNSPCLVTQLRVDASEVDATDLAKMWSRRWKGAGADYVWLINSDVIPQLVNLVLGNFPLYIPGGVHGAPEPAIFGRPVIESEYCQTLGTSGDIILANFSEYQTIDKGGIQAASSIHVQFLTDETAFRFIYRIDGEPLWNSALTPLHGSNTQSPFVVLGASV